MIGKTIKPVRITDEGSSLSVDGISWTPSGNVVFGATSVEGIDLWISPEGKGKPTQLTFGGTSAYPSVSPDGRYIVFQSTASAETHIWRIDQEGGNPIQLTFGDGERHPKCHSDESSVLYLEKTSSGYLLNKVPIQGGVPELINDRILGNRPPAISPDGDKVAVRSYDESSNEWVNHPSR
jgi:Tol biopolymer transport system component